MEETKAMRIVADHIRAAVMMIADGVLPSNKTQGYVLRRLVRRSLLYGRKLGLIKDLTYIGKLVVPVAKKYEDTYPEILRKAEEIQLILQEEALRFGRTLDRGLKEIEKVKMLDGKVAFTLYETYGFPWEMTEEIAREKGQRVDKNQFEEEFRKHQGLSRTAAAGMFKGGLADYSEQTTKLHTATHMLHAALRQVLGEHVQQKGSNITVERLRFDFSHPTKLTPNEIKKVEDIVNAKIKENLPVTFTVIEKEKAVKSGALAFFGERYGKKVKVYTIGPSGPFDTTQGKPFDRAQGKSSEVLSREICGGPHVSFTGTLGHFTMKKEESVGAGIRRIYATVSPHETARDDSTTLSKKT